MSVISKTKQKHFYSHIIETASLSLALGDMNLSQEERLELLSLAHDSLHHTILDTILSELSEEDKKMFLTHLVSDDHDTIWKFLYKKVDNVEEKIKQIADTLKKELHTDIEGARKIKS